MSVIKKIHLIKSDPVNNNNKFWRGSLMDNGDVLREWGRVGDAGKSKLFSGAGESFLLKEVSKKKRDGRNGEIAYREVDIIDDVTVTNSTTTLPLRSNLKTIAMNQIKSSSSNKETSDLIEYMAKVNIHNITSFSGNKIQYNYDKGMFQTELGLVGQSTIDGAREVLVKIGDCVSVGDYGSGLMDYTRDYFMSIPQNIGHKRLDIREFWSDLSKVQQQNSVLDGLQASLVQATTTTPTKTVKKVAEEKVFNVELDPVNDYKLTKEIFDYYYNTRSTMHKSYGYKPKKMWRVTIGNMRSAFESHGANMSNVVPAFHGTSAENLLSLLKSGFLVRPPSSAHISGKLFGNGIYGAPVKRTDGRIISGASTKALNYATSYWGGSSHQRTFMFFIKMAMGKFYTPTERNYRSISYPVGGYDSTWAFGNFSGVRNDESIVYKPNQVDIEYLVEFE